MGAHVFPILNQFLKVIMLAYWQYKSSKEGVAGRSWEQKDWKTSRRWDGTLGTRKGTGLWREKSLPWASQVALVVKNLLPMQKTQETRLQSLGREGPQEEGMATLSGFLDWRISWTQRSGGLQPMGVTVRHNWSNLACTHTSLFLWRWDALISKWSRWWDHRRAKGRKLD